MTQLKHDMENKVWQSEIAIEKKLAELEQAVRDYNRYADKLHLSGPNAKFSQVDLLTNFAALKCIELSGEVFH